MGEVGPRGRMRMFTALIVFVFSLGTMFGVVLMCLVQINRHNTTPTDQMIDEAIEAYWDDWGRGLIDD